MLLTEYNEAQTLQLAREEGRQEGRQEGQSLFAALISKLFSLGRGMDA